MASWHGRATRCHFSSFRGLHLAVPGLHRIRAERIRRRCPPFGTRFSLKFCRNTPERELLAEIGLEFSTQVAEPSRFLGLFRAVSCANFCLSALRLRAHDLFNIHGNRKTRKFTGQDLSALEMRCNAAAFICPRPVVLVSVLDEDRGNMFPMNLMGRTRRQLFRICSQQHADSRPAVEPYPPASSEQHPLPPDRARAQPARQSPSGVYPLGGPSIRHQKIEAPEDPRPGIRASHPRAERRGRAPARHPHLLSCAHRRRRDRLRRQRISHDQRSVPRSQTECARIPEPRPGRVISLIGRRNGGGGPRVSEAAN